MRHQHRDFIGLGVDMQLSIEDARARLGSAVHGVLCTVHPRRGPDPVPVVYAVAADRHVGVPIDRVKPKSSYRLRREANLEADPRSSLLVEHWDASDWADLWWVRASLEYDANPAHTVTDELAGRLARTVRQYEHRPFHRILVFRIVEITGWTAGESKRSHIRPASL